MARHPPGGSESLETVKLTHGSYFALPRETFGKRWARDSGPLRRIAKRRTPGPVQTSVKRTPHLSTISVRRSTLRTLEPAVRGAQGRIDEHRCLSAHNPKVAGSDPAPAIQEPPRNTGKMKSPGSPGLLSSLGFVKRLSNGPARPISLRLAGETMRIGAPWWLPPKFGHQGSCPKMC